MKRAAAYLTLMALPAALAAQVSPTPSFEDPRLQTIAYDPARPARIVAFRDTPLTVMLLSGEQITNTRLSDPAAFEVRTGTRSDSLHITARQPAAAARLVVDTTLRRYEIELAVGDGLVAAYLVRFVDPARVAPPFVPPAQMPVAQPMAPPTAMAPTAMLSAMLSATAPRTAYRLSGERALRPSRIGDDGERTYIEWDAHQSLPAVFGIGANGEEEVVDGYMRQNVFVVDRVYYDLVFRIDRKTAKARRSTALGARG